MSIYQKNLRRLGLLLMAASILDLVLELAFYNALHSFDIDFSQRLQTVPGICIKDSIGVAMGILACCLYRHKQHARWIGWVMIALMAMTLVDILASTEGSLAVRIDSLINATVVLMALLVYTVLQQGRSDRNWERIRSCKSVTLDLKLNDFRQWFNPIEIGPKLELSSEISDVVGRFLRTAREAQPLEITVRCPGGVSDAMQATMQETFQMFFEDEERRINSYLERRYIRAMALVIISIFAVALWINFSPTNDEGITWTILSNFAAFSLWQIGNTYFERAEGYGELLQAQIAKQAKLHFWTI